MPINLWPNAERENVKNTGNIDFTLQTPGPMYIPPNSILLGENMRTAETFSSASGPSTSTALRSAYSVEGYLLG